MKRAYYSNSIKRFLEESNSSILGELSANHTNRTLEDLQKNAWLKQIDILKNQLEGVDGEIYFEFAIPRMGKRVDNIIILHDTVFVVEFKVGKSSYDRHDINQVIDYTLDLKNFHEGSHHTKLVPILVATQGDFIDIDKELIFQHEDVARVGASNIIHVLKEFIQPSQSKINPKEWESSIYKPTPTIIEAAQALYQGHNVEEISRSDAGAINLSKTAKCLADIIESSKRNNRKAICFVTGVPGAGKTLAGLNIANERMKADEDEHAVFLSGNGPLVTVLVEALARDEVATAKFNGIKISKTEAQRNSKSFIQNIHHFRDENLKSENAPIEKVVVFDEAQRAWTTKQVSSFMSRKKGVDNFNKSEPEFLIEVMDRHEDWCTIICLIGGGQEINTGEAGLEEWVIALQKSFSHWDIHYSKQIVGNENYLETSDLVNWCVFNGQEETNLHLGVSVRSFRSEKLSAFVRNLLDLNLEAARRLYSTIADLYPIVITRDLTLAKLWLKSMAKGTERYGIVSSSGARRLRPYGVDVKNKISVENWFLDGSNDVRSSFYLEDVATEFDVQGLELDYICVAWGANFYLKDGDWQYQKFKGTKWQNINSETDKSYLKNTYRVLLTRARQGVVIFIPEGDSSDNTRKIEYFEQTYDYLKRIGVKELQKLKDQSKEE